MNEHRFSGLAFRIDRDHSAPVFAQLYEAIRERISDGALSEGDRLPSSRTLATELGLSRSTVNAAYDQLTAEGYVEGRRGAGFFVCPTGDVELQTPSRGQASPPPPAGGQPRPRVFQPGHPDMRQFPHRMWARHVSRIARTAPEALVECRDPFGDLELRRAISDHIAEWRGVSAPAERIVVTAGSGDALEICIRALAAEGGRVGLEDPGYLRLRHFVESLGLDPVWLDVDASGAAPPDANGRPVDLAVLTPSHQFPLGGAMTPARRTAFLNWAEATGAWIVEDDYDSEFRYSGRPIPAMTGIDDGKRTIYVGSFSKVFSDSLRLGYLAAPEALADAIRTTIGRFGVRASVAGQRPLASFMASGEFYRHIRRVRRIYNDRRKALVDGLDRHFDGLGQFEDHKAGMLTTFRLPKHVDDLTIAAEAAKAGMAPLALSSFHARPGGARGLILGFCAFTPEEIETATPRLAEIVRRQSGA